MAISVFIRDTALAESAVNMSMSLRNSDKLCLSVRTFDLGFLG
jgi:hypothetical protein